MQLENVKNSVGTTEKIKTEESEDNKMKNLKTLQTLSKMGKILSRIAFVFAMIGACGCIIGLLSCRGNSELDDGCGRFKVRHFGVSKQSGFSSFAILREIRTIVENNQDIKVWNLSLGSKNEIRENFISPEAAELDRIQSEFDVIFVVAGTNTPDGLKHPEMKVGAPADSLNSLVVNSVDRDIAVI